MQGLQKKNNNNNAAEEADDGSVRANVNSQEEAIINEVTCEVREDPFTAPFQGERPCWFCAYKHCILYEHALYLLSTVALHVQTINAKTN